MSFGFGKADSGSTGKSQDKAGGKVAGHSFKMTKEATPAVKSTLKPSKKLINKTVAVAKNTTADSNTEVYIGSGTELEGSFSFAGPTYINCKIIGDVKGAASVHLGPEAEVTGNVSGAEVVISGCVKGNVEGSASISLEKPADLLGDMLAPKISVSDGVMFNGKCTMTN